MRHYTKENLFAITYYTENDMIQHINRDGTVVNDIQIDEVKLKPAGKAVKAVFGILLIAGIIICCFALK